MIPTKKLFRNFVIMFAGNTLGQLFFFFGLTHLARVLGPAEFGMWNFAQAWALYLFRIGEFGLEVVGIRETSRDHSQTSKWIATVLLLRIGLATILCGITVLVCLTDLLPSGSTSLVLIFLGAVFSMAFSLEWVYEGRQELAVISFARIAKGLIFFLLVIAFVQTASAANMSVFIYVISIGAPIVCLMLLVQRRFGIQFGLFNVSSVVYTMKKAAPIGGASILSQYGFFIGTIVVGYVVAQNELGYYTAAHRIVVFVWAYVIASLHRVLLPTLSQLHHKSQKDFVRFVDKFFRLSALVTVPIGIVAWLGSDYFVEVLYGSAYGPSGFVLKIMSLALVVAVVRTILEISLIASENQKRYLKGAIILALCYTGLTGCLTYLHGIKGTAYASLISEFLYFVYLIVVSVGTGPTFLLRSIWKPVVAGVAGICVAIVFPNVQVIFQMFLGGVVYMIGLIVMGGVRAKDLEIIRTIFGTAALEDVS